MSLSRGLLLIASRYFRLRREDVDAQDSVPHFNGGVPISTNFLEDFVPCRCGLDKGMTVTISVETLKELASELMKEEW